MADVAKAATHASTPCTDAAEAQQDGCRAEDAQSSSTGDSCPVEAPTGDPATWDEDALFRWFLTFDGGRWSHYAKAFEELNGFEVMMLPKEVICKSSKHEDGAIFYDAWHELRRSTGGVTPTALLGVHRLPGVETRSRMYRGALTGYGPTRVVVIKVVPPSQAAHEERVLKAVGARKEARAIQVLGLVAGVNGVAGINDGDATIDDGDVGIVTPYCPGKLFARASSLHCVLQQAVQLCEALMGWHAAGVLHLDIKPANIATTAEGDVVVLDAGVSRFMEGGSVTVRGSIGTRGYMAPELRGDGRHVAVPACDVFSLGMTYGVALDRWMRASSIWKSHLLWTTGLLYDLHKDMSHRDAAMRPSLPDVLTKLKALASAVSPTAVGNADTPSREQ